MKHTMAQTSFKRRSLQNDAFGLSKAGLGAHSARSMMFLEMRILVRGLPLSVTKDELAKGVIEENVLEKTTLSSRKRSLRHLTALYGMDPTKALFRVLWALGHEDLDSLPQLCLICAYARDPQLRRSFELVHPLRVGEVLDRVAMEQHLEKGFPGRFSPAMKRSMAQNVNTTWTFGGHLAGRVKKIRRFPEPRPISAAYAMFVGYLTGLRGERLLDSPYAALVAPNRSQLQSSLALASSRGLLLVKQAAGIVEFDFSNLLTHAEQATLHESD